MRSKVLIVGLALAASGLAASAQETPKTMVAAYEALADTILAVRDAEATFVRALLDGHRHAAEAYMKKGDYEAAAAEIALFANEGDNAIGGVRKRLLEGGHHHNAPGEEQGIYEPGFVIVTKVAKQKALEIARNLRQASSDEERQQAWDRFASLTNQLLSKE